MNYTFEAIYIAEQHLKNLYEIAKAENNETNMDAATAGHNALMQGIMRAGQDFEILYQLHKDARENGRELINIKSCPFEEDAIAMVEAFNKYGVTSFTMSNTSTSALGVSWYFCKHGFNLTGMKLVVIDANATDYDGTPAPDMVPAYVFEKA